MEINITKQSITNTIRIEIQLNLKSLYDVEKENGYKLHKEIVSNSKWEERPMISNNKASFLEKMQKCQSQVCLCAKKSTFSDILNTNKYYQNEIENKKMRLTMTKRKIQINENMKKSKDRISKEQDKIKTELEINDKSKMGTKQAPKTNETKCNNTEEASASVSFFSFLVLSFPCFSLLFRSFLLTILRIISIFNFLTSSVIPVNQNI